MCVCAFHCEYNWNCISYVCYASTLVGALQSVGFMYLKFAGWHCCCRRRGRISIWILVMGLRFLGPFVLHIFFIIWQRGGMASRQTSMQFNVERKQEAENYT